MIDDTQTNWKRRLLIVGSILFLAGAMAEGQLKVGVLVFCGLVLFLIIMIDFVMTR